MRQRRFTPTVAILVALMVMTLAPALHTAADSAADTGDVTIEIVPPGALTSPPAKPGEVAQPGPGTLSAILMWLPDPAVGQTRMHGLLAVQDHRARADGWTVRLLGDDSQPLYLMKVHVGGAGFGIPEWLYVGIHAWDVAVGASLAKSPQLVTAPRGNGYSLTIHQLWIDVDPLALGATGSRYTLVLILPFAP